MVPSTLMALLAAMVLVLAGCAPLVSGPGGNGALEPGTVLDGSNGAELSKDQVARRLGQARVVLVGETHDHPGHHQAQLAVLRLMAAGGSAPVVGVEWLDHTAQPLCDELSAGGLTVEEFARKVDWERRWGYPLKLYAPILEEVRAQGFKLVALNAPTKVVRQVARKGLQSLTAEQRAALAPTLDLDDASYRKMLERQFKSHGVSGMAGQENFIAAQVVRDETMAHNFSRALEPWPDGNARGLVLAGAGHLAHGQGLAPRIRRRLPGAKVLTVLPVSNDRLGSSGRHHGPGAPADLLWITTPAPPRPPRLGVMLNKTPAGLEVVRVLPEHAAQKAGVKKGDVLTAVDGKPLKRAKDIHDAIKSAPHEPHTYQVQRGAETLEIIIDLSPEKGGPRGPGQQER